MNTLDDYATIVGEEVVGQLYRLAEHLQGRRFVHINSTAVGGGVAEILSWAVLLLNQLGLQTTWEVIMGDPAFFEVTKAFHNGLQGFNVHLTPAMLEHYRQVNLENARRFSWEADVVLVHDPQPASLIEVLRPQARRWVWRCHIDASRPQLAVWRFLREIVKQYDASVFSMSQFAQNLPHPQYLIRPSIDPLSEKNRDLTEEEIKAVASRRGASAQASRPSRDAFQPPVPPSRASCRKPIGGPGNAEVRVLVPHGPMIPLQGTVRFSTRRRHAVGVAVLPSADG